MKEEATLSEVGMYVAQGCLVVPIQLELDDELVSKVQQEILEQLVKTRAKGLIVDLARVAVIDSVLGKAIFDIAGMASLLGTVTVITGIGPGVAASLIDLDFEPGDVLTATTMEVGFEVLSTRFARLKTEPGKD